MRVDINCDMGESYGRWSLGDDVAMMDVITSANVACGFHGGDPNVMVETARLRRRRASMSARIPASTTSGGSGDVSSGATRWRRSNA